jgi:hypothetical protein
MKGNFKDDSTNTPSVLDIVAVRAPGGSQCAQVKAVGIKRI